MESMTHMLYYRLSPPYTREPTPYRITKATMLPATCVAPTAKQRLCSRIGPKRTNRTLIRVKFVVEMMHVLGLGEVSLALGEVSLGLVFKVVFS